MNYKDSQWAKKILDLQHDNGSWGYFHCPLKQPITTEQALQRLEILGFTIDDVPIQKTIKYLHNCLIGKEDIPDRVEKIHDWKIFTELIISTWIKRFTLDDKHAINIANKWSEIINNAFVNNKFDQNIYNRVYCKTLNMEKGKKIIGFMNFYLISLLANNLEKTIEPIYFEYVLNYPRGIYYFGYDKPIKTLPEIFASRETSAYIRMIELLTEYKSNKCKKQLYFIKEWIEKNGINSHEWDLGKSSKDNILLPLSDSWRKDEDRIKDCTDTIKRIIKKL